MLVDGNVFPGVPRPFRVLGLKPAMLLPWLVVTGRVDASVPGEAEKSPYGTVAREEFSA